MKYLSYITIFIVALYLFSCASDIVDITGSISGTVKDASNNTGIEGCHVTISPSNISKTTNSAGFFSFENLDAGAYSLSFSKDGYESQTKDLTVEAGRTANTDILLKPIEQAISVNPTSLNFGDLETTKELYLSKNRGNNTQYSIKADQKWISVSPTSGTLGNTNVKITVVVNRSELSSGEFSGTITITSSFGETSVPVFMIKAESSVPQIANGEACYDVTETSFKINGTILKTGGSEITSYGHCWSKNETPTIADSKTNLGSTKEIGEYTSTVNKNLTAGETYYVRAYAENKIGIGYSNSVRITIPKMTTPTVATSAPADIAKNSAVLNGSITNTGNGEITECGFYYGKTNNPTTKVTCSSVANTFSYNLSSLTEGTTYYYKAYAKNAKGESCGEVVSFTTSSSTSEGTSGLSVTTGEATNIAYSSATLNASVSGEFKGAKEISEYGFYIGANQYQLQKKTAKTLTGDNFDLTIEKLDSESKYYYYAYVLCYDRTELKGEQKTFTTLKEPKITSIKYICNKTVDNELWLNLSVTVDPAGLQIKDAGFLMGDVYSDDNLHHQFLQNVMIVSNCEVQDNTLKYDGLAKKYDQYNYGKQTHIKPYFVLEDGTELYGKVAWMYDGVNDEKEY